jgi:SpoIIAA-like
VRDRDDGRMIEVLGGFPDHVAAYICHAHMTKDDYESVLMPDVADRLTRHKKIRAYIQMGDDFAGVEPGALWDDTKFGLSHMLDWERIALVTDVDWMKHAAQFYNLLGFFGSIRAFPTAEMDKAREWIAEL